MGSITKVMTALVVIRAGDLSRKITIPSAVVAYVRKYDASSAGLRPGDKLTASQLLAALLLPSGADAAYALAEAYGPGLTAFIAKMNATAKQLGLTRTHFANFDGLPWPTEHSTYSTPHDLILLAEAAMKLPAFRQIVAQRSHSIAATRHNHHYYWRNTNLLLGSYPGAIGIKTGFTQGAGYCLLFAARKGKTELIGVVLDSTRTNPQLRFTAATNMLTWGFAHVPG
jgi:D-alanyl-D-alanine carboxypeptidase (penicillin-binding protein 5/6)